MSRDRIGVRGGERDVAGEARVVLQLDDSDWKEYSIGIEDKFVGVFSYPVGLGTKKRTAGYMSKLKRM